MIAALVSPADASAKLLDVAAVAEMLGCPCCGNPYEPELFVREQLAEGGCHYYCQHCGCLVDFARIPQFSPSSPDKC